MTEISKEVELKSKAVQEAVARTAEDIKKENMQTVEQKHKDIENHFDKVRQEVDRAYPGGVAFLESSKQAKL
jgi:archaellum component FlaC